MSGFWVKARQILPVCAAYLSLSASIEAAELPKLMSVNLNQQKQFIPQISSNFYLEKNTRALLLTQINSVDRLRDIKPTDWSYAALKNLIERYGCINGFSNRTFRGEQTISRAEFTAGLNSCLNKIESLISNSDSLPQTDVDTVLRLKHQFQLDLAILKGKTDGSQARLQDLEATQFSTTSKLKGEAILGLGSLLAGDRENSTILGSRLRLNIETSFRGDDLLLTRLSSLKFPGFDQEIGTFQGELAFAEAEQDDFQLEVLQYTFGVDDKVDFILGATGLEADDIADTISILDGDGGSGAISRFGTRNPIYNRSRNAGLGIVGRPMEQIEISAGYLASTADKSNPGSGLFNGPYSALGQIAIAPTDSLSLAATYIHSYDQSDTETGTNRANLQSQTVKLLGEETSTVSNSYGLELSWEISDRLVIGGWGGLSKVSNLSNLNQQIERCTQNIWNWAATLALPDLGKEGSLAGIVVGSEPMVTSSTINTDNFGEDSQRSLHLEAFYQYQINDNIAITPGVVWITEPDTDIDSDDLLVGTIRTTFSF